MKIERYINNSNEFRCFGFPNGLVGKSGVKEILSQLPGLKITHWNKSWGVEVFCAFRYKGQKFEVSEPYGDNSYYDILCEEPNTPELEALYTLFLSTSVPTRKPNLRVILLVVVITLLIAGLNIYDAS
ncbi:hypothetical protein [Porticoccus sp.]